MDPRELLASVRRVEIRTRGMVDHLFSGEYKSVFKGRGMAFSEVREYQYGDDVRSIDWNVSARFDHPFVKVFEEERELTVMLLVDQSRSGDFGSGDRFKLEVAAEICAVLAFSAVRNNDKVGLLLFTDRVERFIPPRKGRSHILRIVRELLSSRPRGTGTDLRGALEYFHRVARKRTIAFLVSDFMDEGYEKILAVCARKHDLVAVELGDPREERLPDAGLLRLVDAETGQERWIDSGDREVRRAFEDWHAQRKARRRKLFLRTRVDAIPVRTDLPFQKPLADFFKTRERRLR
jgi:uncharacterized protein (DUF58 family)